MKVKGYSILLSTSRTQHLFTSRTVFFHQISNILLLIWFQSQDLGFQAPSHRNAAAAEASAGSS